MNDTLPCETIQELLPLYVEGSLSEESNQAVEQHLKLCSSCRRKEQLEREGYSLRSLDAETRQCALFSRRLRRRKRVLQLLGCVLAGCALVCAVSLPLVRSGRENAMRWDAYLEGAAERMEQVCGTLEAMEQNPDSPDLRQQQANLHTECLALEGYFSFQPMFSRYETMVWDDLIRMIFLGSRGNVNKPFLEDGVLTGKELGYVSACADSLRQVLDQLEGASREQFLKQMDWLESQYYSAAMDFLLS